MQPGQQYRLFCRKHGSLDAAEEVLVDENALAEGHAYCRVYLFDPSPDHTLLAYSVDTTGAWVFDLYSAVAAGVPFTNVITAMLTPDLPLTVVEWEQWGHPDDPQAFDYMLSYSPYENVTAQGYPHIFAKAGLNDLQVPYWDPAKWVAKLRALKTDDNCLLLLTNMESGHGGASGRYDTLRETAEVYAFLLDTLGASLPYLL
jgi:protease II